ncbi:DciA family protein [Alkalilimnicola sp. S0819]|uniref:DciA family protein n=1 Tax=Alkalilimnicola sp. S0819 TaxID=2613922 RepID=UPI001261AF6D|nr:DciA family protein [Alkalilimnicola sp. S0819]KAB7623126.1 DUF721 domain-containing protein [Alkalilimnicola sp. S0819]MPQ16970.1 DUF721 domain-containing protein [Alkalilimnicola sp. S0819]
MPNAKPPHAQPPHHWLRSQHSPLGQIRQRARQLAMLTRQLQQDALPDSLRGKWQVARLDAQELVLVADSSLWASQLRYLGRRLQDAAEAYTGIRPARVSIKIAEQRQAPPEQREKLSAEAARTLRQAAEGFEDARLRRALLHLARRADRSPKD